MSPRPPWPFWLLLGYCLVLAVGELFVRAEGNPTEESTLRATMLESEARLAEASEWAAATGLAPQGFGTLSTHVEIAEGLGRQETTPAGTRERLAALVWLYADRTRDDFHARVNALLPPEADRSRLGKLIATLASTAKAPAATDPEVTGALGARPGWLERRLVAELGFANHPLPADVPFARGELDEFKTVAGVLGGVVMLGFVGMLLLLLWPWLKKRLAEPAASPPLPFSTTWWLPVHVIAAWFAFANTSGFLMHALLGGTGLSKTGWITFSVLHQVGFGLFGLWLVGRIGLLPSSASLLGVVRALEPGLEPYGGRAGRALGHALLAVAMALPLVLIAELVQVLLPFTPTAQGRATLLLFASPPSDLAAVLLLLSAIVVAPFFEEALFRGYLYRVLRERIGLRWATLLSALVFAAVHLSPEQLLPLTVLGLVFTRLYERSGGLLAPMLAHAIWNGTELLKYVAVYGR